MHNQHDEAKHISLGTSCRIGITKSLTNRLAMAVCQIGHCGHQTSVCYISMGGVTSKTWCMNIRRMQEMNYFGEFSILQGTLMTSQFFIRSHSPQPNESGCASNLTALIINIY
jgi:hypothetical protein